MKNIGTKVAKGALWMVLFKFTERSLGIISTIILARLLVPEDFGLIAMAMSIIAVLELMGAFGFDMALIQNQKAERSHYDTAWTFNVLFAVISSILLVLIAVPTANFYHEPRLELIIYFLALGTFITGFENIGVVAFRKDLEFRKEFKFLVLKKVASFSVTIPLAFIMESYWALVIGILTGKVFSVLISYLMHHYRPKLCLSKAAELFSFSKWLLINNILYFLRLHSADFIVGRLLGAHTLGVYTVAFEISNLPTTELIAPINRAVYPGYAKMASDLALLRTGFLNTLTIITLFAIPAGIGILATADLVVRVVLGDKWLEAIPVIQILAIYGVATAIQTNTLYIFLATGKPRISTALSALYVLILLPTLYYLCLDYGMVGAAWSYAIVAGIMLPVTLLVTFKYLRIAPMSFFKCIWRIIISAIVMYFSVTQFIAWVGDINGIAFEIVVLLTAVAIGALTYTTTLLTLWIVSGRPSGGEESILDKAFPKLPSFLQLQILKTKLPK